MGNAFLYPTTIVSIGSYFPVNSAYTITSLVVGICFGGAAFGVLAHYTVNPNNLPMVEVAISDSMSEFYFPPEVNANVPSLLRMVLLLWACIFFISILAISFNPDGDIYKK
jgi:hypothetical protein